MAVIDTLNINLQATTAGLQKGLKSAQGMVTNFAGSLTGPLGKLAGVFGAAFSANAVKDFVLSGIDAADEMEHIAEEIGTTAEAFNQLRHAAALTDVTQEQLVGGLEKMQKNLGEAAQGSEKAAEGFENIGLSAEHLRRMTPEQQFKAIATQIAAIKDPAEKAAAAADIFGKAGQKLIPLLNQGEQGLTALGAEVAGAFSEEKRKGLKAANDAIDVMGEAFKSMKHEVVVALAPAVVMITKEFEKWLKYLTQVVELLKASLGEPTGGGRPKGAPPPNPTRERAADANILWALVLASQAIGARILGLGPTAREKSEKADRELAEALRKLTTLLGSDSWNQQQLPGVEL